MEERQLPVPLSDREKTLAALVNESVNQTLSRYQLDTARQQKAYAFLLELTGGTPLYILLSQEGIDHYHQMVFSDTEHRNFVFSAYSAFVGRYSSMQDDWDGLNALIARAASIRSDDQTSNIPDVIADRLYTREEIYAAISGNTWLVMLALIVMFWNSALVSNTSAKS